MHTLAPARRAAAPRLLLAVFTAIAALALASSAHANGGLQPQIAAGAGHTCAVGDDGSVKCWGVNAAGQLGNGGTADAAAPTPIAGVVAAKNNSAPVAPVLGKVSAIAASSDATCAISDGTIWCWGSNVYGQLGAGTSDPDPHPTPQAVAGTKDFYAITAGRNHFCAATWQGELSCWGLNAHGQIGTGAVGGSVLAPAKVAGTKKFKSIAAGGDFTCVLPETTKPKCWGADDRGQLGRGAPGAPNGTPGDVPNVKDAYRLVAGDAFVCALGWTETPLRCWGDNQLGQLAQGTLGETAPRAASDVTGLGDVKVVGGTATSACAVARLVTAANSKPLSADKYLTCWGDNSDGRLGTGDTTSSGSPRTVKVSEVADLSAGAAATRQCAIVRGGEVFCWGAGASFPAQVDGLDLVTKPQYPSWAYIEPASRLRLNAAGTAWRIGTRIKIEPSPFVFAADACRGRIVTAAYYYKRVRAASAAQSGVQYKKVGVRKVTKLRRAGDYCKSAAALSIPLARFGSKKRQMKVSATGYGNAALSSFSTNEFALKDVKKILKGK